MAWADRGSLRDRLATGPPPVVVANVGWETASGDTSLVRELSTAAVDRAARLNHR